MTRKVIIVIAGCVLSISLLGSTCAHAGSDKDRRVYEGRWWLSIPHAEQSGFIHGFLDCYIYDVKGPAHFSGSAYTYRHALNRYFRRMRAITMRQHVGRVLLNFRDPKGYKVTDKYAEHVTAAHGGDDGLYWMQLSLSKGEQTGFVEGYLACHSELKPNDGVAYSRTPAEYVQLINKWYKFSPATGDISAKRQPVAIADVLFRFRDHPGHSASKSN